jgi:hypothetical protein
MRATSLAGRALPAGQVNIADDAPPEPFGSRSGCHDLSYKFMPWNAAEWIIAADQLQVSRAYSCQSNPDQSLIEFRSRNREVCPIG